jgi:glycosyltransferase involved in cell wall biosynthesis
MSSNLRQAPGVTASLYRVAVLVPCYNEARAIAKAVADFPAALPEASVYVYDNNSTDGTIAARESRGCHRAPRDLPGRAFVVSRMFNDVKADIYVLVDDDATYDAPSGSCPCSAPLGLH